MATAGCVWPNNPLKRYSMIEFINAKINIGLQIVNRRADGYHDLQTVFYPVGIYAGTPENPEEFGDILELSRREEDSGHSAYGMPEIEFRGRKIDCAPEKNLVWRAAQLFAETTGTDASGLRLTLEKHLPDGAGMGGGSADASFTLRLLARHFGLNNLNLEELAVKLGADCPFFVRNRPVYAEGIGEKMTDIDLDLSGRWLVAVQPYIRISTREAFSGVTPKKGDFDLKMIARVPVEDWKGTVRNDFEDSIRRLYPEIEIIKEELYARGALYASLTGSGSVVYGIFSSLKESEKVRQELQGKATIERIYLLKM